MFVYDNEPALVASILPLLINLLHGTDKNQQQFIISQDFCFLSWRKKRLLNISTHKMKIHEPYRELIYNMLYNSQ